MGTIGTLDEKDLLILEEHIDDRSTFQRILAQDAFIKYRDSQLRIEVASQVLKQQTKGLYKLIEGKAILSNGKGSPLELDCLVACGHWHKLEAIPGDTINILDYLHQLLPRQGRSIGLFSFQNGIQNSFQDFNRMGAQILSNLQAEKPLCIGLYNKTNGLGFPIFLDLKRLLDEWTLNPHSILFMRQMMVALAGLLPSINPQLLWTHIAHSEAGLISNSILTTPQNALSHQQSSILKNILITATYGAVAPIPNVVRYAVNNYSKDDIVLNLVKRYLDKIPRPETVGKSDKELHEIAQQIHKHMLKPTKTVEAIAQELKNGQGTLYKTAYIDQYPYECTKSGCTLRILASQVPKEEQPKIEGDHAFTGETYRNALNDNIARFRRDFRIYNGK